MWSCNKNVCRWWIGSSELAVKKFRMAVLCEEYYENIWDYYHPPCFGNSRIFIFFERPFVVCLGNFELLKQQCTLKLAMIGTRIPVNSNHLTSKCCSSGLVVWRKGKEGKSLLVSKLVTFSGPASHHKRSGQVRSGPVHGFLTGLTQQLKERKKKRKKERGMGWKINRKGVLLHVSMWIERRFKVVDGLIEGNLLCMAGRMQGLPEQINGEAGMLQRGSKQPRPLEDGNWVCDDPSCTNVNYPRRTEVCSVLSSSSQFISPV